MKRPLPFLAFALFTFPALAQSLSGVESVEYDAIHNRYLASSDNTSIVAIAPNGALSHFGNGADADYGMEVSGNALFVIAGNLIRSYDLNTEGLLFSQHISGAAFLNGMASHGDSIWFTDFSNKDIFAMDVNDPSGYTKVVSNTVETPNGIVYDGANNRCLFTTWGSNASIKAMGLDSFNISYVVQNTGLGNIDGIDGDDSGNWYVSSWSPARITKYNNDFSTSEIITVPGINNPADICYAPETDTLAIPGGNQVLFIGFENTVGVEDVAQTEDTHVTYNAGFPVIHFKLSNSQDATLEVLDASGRTVYTVFDGLQPSGAQTVVLSSIGLYPGAYLCRLRSKGLSFTERIVVP